jgi:hypothetical protein
MNLDQDIQSMLALAAPFAGTRPTAVTLPSGAVVQAMVQLASENDALLHENVICGQTAKLIFSSAQVPGLATGQNITWNGQAWGILTTDLEANGAATVCFIGGAFA